MACCLRTVIARTPIGTDHGTESTVGRLCQQAWAWQRPAEACHGRQLQTDQAKPEIAADACTHNAMFFVSLSAWCELSGHRPKQLSDRSMWGAHRSFTIWSTRADSEPSDSR